LETFLLGDTRSITVPGTDRQLSYDPLARIGVGMSRLGTSEAVAVGAYAFALQQLESK
jgi:glucokinase